MTQRSSLCFFHETARCCASGLKVFRSVVGIDRQHLASIARTEPPPALPQLAANVVAAKIKGRVVGDVKA